MVPDSVDQDMGAKILTVLDDLRWGQGTAGNSQCFHFSSAALHFVQALASAGGGTCCEMLCLVSERVAMAGRHSCVLGLPAAGLCSWIWLAMPPYSEPARGSFYLPTEAMSRGPSGCNCWTFLSGID